jgi:hypothetical protein
VDEFLDECKRPAHRRMCVPFLRFGRVQKNRCSMISSSVLVMQSRSVKVQCFRYRTQVLKSHVRDPSQPVMSRMIERARPNRGHL